MADRTSTRLPPAAPQTRLVTLLNRGSQSAGKQVAMIFLTILILFPMFFIFNNALKTRDQYMANPLSLAASPTLANFVKIFQNPQLLTWFGNSLILTAVSVGLCTLISILAAYAFANMQFPGRDLLFNLITPLMVVPPIVMLIPLFVLFQIFGLINNLSAPILVYTGLMLPFTIFLLRNFFITIPREIREAALLDGCSSLQLLTKIYLPLSRPALVTSMVVNAVWVWNELLIALVFLQTEAQRTLIVGVAASMQKRFNLDIPLLMAGLAVVTIPMVILYVVGQNSLVRGLTAGFEK
jgi:ABC-type glycerol-3-phosphate transport system permease component